MLIQFFKYNYDVEIINLDSLIVKLQENYT